MRLSVPIVRGSSDNWRKSPCPPVTVITAPEGKIRGPAMIPESMALFSPNTGPPRSRTVVKPRISVSVASTPAAILLYPASPTIISAGVPLISIACQCASIRPGISVRPFPAITVMPGSGAIGSVEMRSMILPWISTLDGADSEAPLPSKMRTFWNNVALAFAGGLPCARAAATSPMGISESACDENPSGHRVH